MKNCPRCRTDAFVYLLAGRHHRFYKCGFCERKFT